MARIAGIDLPRNKRMEIALTYIYGIGRRASNSILSGLSTANLLSPVGELTRRGSLVLVVAGPTASVGPDDSPDREGSQSMAAAVPTRSFTIDSAAPRPCSRARRARLNAGIG